ncbi:hypothetical protein FSHL1_006853 [Fusarium sambucinum]
MVIPQHLLEKYTAEQAKRLRPEQVAQFVDFRDPMLASMDIDPYVDYDALASKGFPLKDGCEVKFLIAGGGMLGLMTVYHLVTKAGISSADIIIVDKAGGQFCTTITNQKWDEEEKRWVVTLSHKLSPSKKAVKLTVRTQFLCLAGGIQISPHTPKLNGLGVFQSKPNKVLMHTGRWNWSKSGGSQDNRNMVKLQAKRVGIVGTGATAVQVALHIAEWAKEVYVFQRTPSYVEPQQQKETTITDWAQVADKLGWQYERMASLDAMFTAKQVAEEKIKDGWTKVAEMTTMSGHAGKVITKEMEEQHIKDMLNLDLPWTDKMRSRVDVQVKGPATAQKLKAWYSGFCKRPTFHPSYLSLFNEPHVTLIDTDGKSIEAYTPNGVMANGEERELDVLVLATGYTVGLVDPCPSSALNAPLLGRDNRFLKNKWDGLGRGTLYGTMTE